MKVPKRINLTRPQGWFSLWGFPLWGFPLWGSCTAAIISLCPTAPLSLAGGSIAAKTSTGLTQIVGSIPTSSFWCASSTLQIESLRKSCSSNNLQERGDTLLLQPQAAGKPYAAATFSTPEREFITPPWQNPELLDTIEGHTAIVSSLAFSPDGKILASGGGRLDTNIHIWNLEKRKRIATLSGHQGTVLTMAFAPDGKTLVSGGEDGLVNLWDIESEELIHTFAAHTSHIMSLAITPDGNTLVSAALDGMVVWNLPERHFVESLLRFQPTYSAAIAANGRVLATGGKNKEIQLWNLSPNCNGRASCLAEESNPRGVLKGHEGPVSALGFAADGEILVSGSHDRTISLWNLSNGFRKILGRHNSEVKSLAISPDGRAIASAGRDGIKLWHLRTGLLHDISEGVEGVRALAFSPDGNILATGGANNTIKIWQNGQIVRDR